MKPSRTGEICTQHLRSGAERAWAGTLNIKIAHRKMRNHLCTVLATFIVGISYCTERRVLVSIYCEGLYNFSTNSWSTEQCIQDQWQLSLPQCEERLLFFMVAERWKCFGNLWYRDRLDSYQWWSGSSFIMRGNYLQQPSGCLHRHPVKRIKMLHRFEMKTRLKCCQNANRGFCCKLWSELVYIWGLDWSFTLC